MYALDPENYEPFCGRCHPVFARTRSHGRCWRTRMGRYLICCVI